MNPHSWQATSAEPVAVTTATEVPIVWLLMEAVITKPGDGFGYGGYGNGGYGNGSGISYGNGCGFGYGNGCGFGYGNGGYGNGGYGDGCGNSFFERLK